MTFKFRYADRIVGIFILVALLFVLFMLVVAGVNRQWFAHQYRYHSRFTSASGLSVGMAISFKGVEVGSVKDFRLNEENTIDMDLVIYEAYIDKLKPNSVLELTSNPLGLGGGLTLYPGNNDSPFPEEGSYIPSTQFEEGQLLVAQGLTQKEEGGDMISELMSTVPDLLTHVDETVVSVNSLIITLDRSLQGDPGAGPVGEILWDAEGALEEVNVLLAGLTSLVSELEEAENLIPQLVGTEGVVGGLFSDEADFYGHITGLTDQVLVSLYNLSTLTGTLSGSSPQIELILTQLSSTLTEAEDVLEGLSNNPLLKGGIEENVEVPSGGGASHRDEEF
ncbi:MAG: MlaD family protein [Spirochaetales bacterium]|nr:MlaD family protein [Spirochaetales bacterium]